MSPGLRTGAWLALATGVFLPAARDAFELPQALVLASGALLLRAHVPSRALGAIVALTLGAIVVSLAFSEAPGLGVGAVALLLTSTVFALRSSELDWRPVALMTLPIGAWAALQATGHDFLDWDNASHWCGGVRPFATLGHPTQLGVWMAGMTIVSVGLALERRSLGFAVIAAIASAVCIATLSRAGWLALSVGLVAFAAAATPRVSSRSVAIASVFVLGALACAGLLAGGPALVERIEHALVAPTRFAMAKTALAGFAVHPFLGWGTDTFVLVDQSWRLPEAWKFEWGVTAGHAHSYPFQVLATQGLLGAIALGGAVAVTVVTWWRTGAPRRRPTEFALVLALAAAAMVSFHGVLTMTLFWIALVRTTSSEPSVEERWSRWLVVPLLGVLTASVWANLDGGAAVRASGPDTERLLTRASRLEPWSPLWPALHGEWLERTGVLDRAAERYAEALGRAPSLAVSWANVGRVASQRGERQLTLEAFDRARRLAPLDGRIALDAAESSLRVGDVELAASTLEALVVLYPSDGPAWFALGRARVLQGRREEARAILGGALEADWRDWPEGVGRTRRLLASLSAEAGELETALAVLRGPAVATIPTEVCGAPAKLR